MASHDPSRSEPDRDPSSTPSDATAAPAEDPQALPCDGDRVVSHVRMTGTNDGGIAWAGVPANGKAIDVDWIQISRHGDDGTIQETWAQMDLLKLMIDVGAIPAPEGM